MKIKKWIRNWLCVAESSATVETKVPHTLSETQVRKIVADTLDESFDPKPLVYLTGFPIGFQGKIERIIRKVYTDEVRQEVTEQWREKFGSEDFIDSVVKRINKKQVGRG